MTMRRMNPLFSIRILAGTAACASVFIMTPAHAGFEWLPPAQVMNTPTTPTLSPAATPQEFVPMNAPDASAFNTAPGPYAGAEMLPSPVAPMEPPAANSGNLVINPYPMAKQGYGDVLMGVGPVEHAMMAESRELNPLPLGYGMNTGSKTRAMAPTYPAPMAAAQQPPTNIIPMQKGPGGISPMPGGPLEPLPGYAAAPVQQIAMAVPVQAATPLLAEPIIDRAPIMAAKPIAIPPMAPEPAVYTPPPAAPAPVLAMKAAPKIQQPPVTQPAIPVAATTTGSAFPEAVGFGNDLPLALALSQIIPEGYAMFFETKVDAEKTNVSWQGGKPWDQALQEMLAPLGLRAEIQPNLVMIRGA